MKVLKIKRNSKIKGKFKIITHEAGTKNVVSETDWIENLISTAENHGLNLFIKHLFGDVTYSLPITRARFGTTDVAPSATDTDIDSPLAYDIEIASRELISNTEMQIVFFAPNVFIPDDTYYTFATYCGSRTFSMALIRDENVVDFEKVGSVDTTILYNYEIINP
jgi:hypothetical protein